MKTEEFFGQVAELPFVSLVGSTGNGISMFVADQDGNYIVAVSRKYRYAMVIYKEFGGLCYSQQDKLMAIVWKYIKTPVEER